MLCQCPLKALGAIFFTNKIKVKLVSNNTAEMALTSGVTAILIME